MFFSENAGRVDCRRIMSNTKKPTEKPAPSTTQPPPGSWADVARMMAQGDDSGFDWDAWKDQQKEERYGE
jgi:hypothetical protein